MSSRSPQNVGYEYGIPQYTCHAVVVGRGILLGRSARDYSAGDCSGDSPPAIAPIVENSRLARRYL